MLFTIWGNRTTRHPMAGENKKQRAPRNRTIDLSPGESDALRKKLIQAEGPLRLDEIRDRTINGDLFRILEWLPSSIADLIFLDPPYNLTKSFNGSVFQELSGEEYAEWLDSWLSRLLRVLKPDGSVYICGDWRSASAIHGVAGKYLKVRNRITWEREKGRGASRNWKMCSEDIWFCTLSGEFTFNLDAVKLKRRVIAPYRNADGHPKDWEETEDGSYRTTHPSNLWTDLTVPFWSMPENTDHPTQKPEKLVAKIVLASSHPGGLVLDPFLGSGTTSVVARKLGRHFVGIEKEQRYCLLAEKRLALAERDKSIQGFAQGVFWERNSLPEHKRASAAMEDQTILPLAFGSR
jgi:site-specific DNA-methyltransferase (adenine-specific)